LGWRCKEPLYFLTGAVGAAFVPLITELRGRA
jgi:hypothetical protein